jgi:signal transduction histidine kinase
MFVLFVPVLNRPCPWSEQIVPSPSWSGPSSPPWVLGQKGSATNRNAEGSRSAGASALSRSRLSIRHAFEIDPLLADGLLAFALVVLGVVGLLAAVESEPAPATTSSPPALAAVLVMFQTTPITWRRRSPLTVLIVVELATIAYHLLHYPFTGADLGALVAFYTVASRYDARAVLAAAAGFACVVLALTFQGRMGFELFALLQVLFAVAWIMGAELRIRRTHTALVEDRAARLERELGYLAREAVADERARITRELHETVTANLSMIVAQAKVAERALPVGAAPPMDAIDFIRKTGEQTLAELRRAADVLRPEDPVVVPPASPSAMSQLGALVTEVKMAGLPVDVVVEGDARPLPAEVDGSAYRIVQEALTNCLKHAGPVRPQLVIRYGVDDLELVVTEDAGSWEVDPEAGRRENLGWMRPRSAAGPGAAGTGPSAPAGAGPWLDGTYGVRARLPI